MNIFDTNENRTPMLINENISSRTEPKTYDARGNGSGYVSCTITGAHQSTISDYTAIAVQGGEDCMNGENAIVRRLTPVECERLQGMPDDWSKYGIDENGNVYELSDSARYKLQGNGIATPFWFWLMERISEQYKGDQKPTLASLFDGQGSFPMIWENINGKGTALWSSEIEKHAIAVAKYHFPECEKKEEKTDDNRNT